MAENSGSTPIVLTHSGTYRTRAEIHDGAITIAQTNRAGGVDCVILPRDFADDIAAILVRPREVAHG